MPGIPGRNNPHYLEGMLVLQQRGRAAYLGQGALSRRVARAQADDSMTFETRHGAIEALARLPEEGEQ